MENIELRWVIRPTPVLDASTGILNHVPKTVLQYRKYYDRGAYAGLYGVPAGKNLQWSDWTDVPTVMER
jgi:hypothetical protein